MVIRDKTMSNTCRKCGYNDFNEAGQCIYCEDKISWLKPGTILDGRYDIVKAVKAGGMGAVYKAKDRRLNQICAVKEMLSEDPHNFDYLKDRFLEEACLLAELRHNGIPRVTDYFTYQNRYYLVMDYLHGRDLYSYIVESSDGRISIDEDTVVKWGIEICHILIYLHGQKPRPVLHRDIKPSNTFLSEDGRIMLIDFGLARTVNPDSFTEKTAVGTMGYAPMEQYQGHPDARSDLYALAGVMHFLLTAVHPAPFKFEPLKSIRPDVSDWLDNIIKKCLSLYPDNRFSSALELKEVLEKKKDAGEYKDDSGDLEEMAEKIPGNEKKILARRGFLSHRKNFNEQLKKLSEFDLNSPDDVEKVIELGEKGNRKAVEPLIKMLESEYFKGKHRKVIDLLGNYKDDRVVKPLIKALSSSDETIRRYAPAALAKTGNKEAVNELVKLIMDPSLPVKKSAIRAILKLTGKNTLSLLERFLTREEDNYISNFPENRDLYFDTVEDLICNYIQEKEPLKCNVHLSILYEADKMYFEAIESMNRALSINPDNIELLQIYARLLECSENYDKAEIVIKKVLAIKKGDYEFRLKYADILEKLNRFSEAIEIYDDLYLNRQEEKLEGRLRELYYNYGNYMEKGGKFREAKEQYENAILINPNHKDILFFQALVDFKNRKHKKSVKTLEKYIKENPGAFWSNEAENLVAEIKRTPYGSIISWARDFLN